MNNIYIDCIHCGYIKLTKDDIFRVARRGQLAGIVCKNCNEEAQLLQMVATPAEAKGYITITFRVLTVELFRDAILVKAK
jgi:Zn ribbon nucleic-acid-binding protein